MPFWDEIFLFGETPDLPPTIMSSNEASSSKAPPPAADDVEKLLSREATAFQREVEVERILKAFKLK